MSTHQLAIVMAILALGHVTRGQTDQDQIDAIDAFIRDIMVSEEMVGLGVSVVKDGRPLMAEGYGQKHVVDGGDVTNDTLWYLASCSKALNAALVVKLLSEDGRYTVDSRVREIWPEFTLGTGFRSEHTTIRDLLSHRTGVVDSLFGILAGAMQSRDDYMNRARFFPTLYPFRDAESYNNLMVTIAGHVAEILAGKTWEEALQEHILDPLDMDQTAFVDRLTPEQYDAMATAHDDDGGIPRPISKDIFGANLGPASPSGGLVTSAVDMQKWLYFLTNGGLAQNGSRVMNESDVMQIMKDVSLAKYPVANDNPLDPIVYSETGVALGWYSGIYRGYNMAAHGGFFFGFQSKVTVLPDLGLAVYVNINCPDGYTNASVMFRVSSFVLDTLLGVQPSFHPMTQTKSRKTIVTSHIHEPGVVRDQYSPTALTSHKRNAQYAGTYGNFIFGNMTVLYNDSSDTLWGEWTPLAVMVFVEAGVDFFLGIVQEPLWFAPPLPVTFSSSDGQVYDRMEIPFLLPQAPPTFIRDLSMDDAPPPPTGNCEAPVF